MFTIAFHTLGCKVNQYETEAITEQFIKRNYQVVDFESVADIYIVNTCTVTNIADKKSRKMLSRARKLNPEAIIVAIGCYVQAAHDQHVDIPYVDLLVGNKNKGEVVDVVEEYIKNNVKMDIIDDVTDYYAYEELQIQHQLNRTRSTIKIQDGCNQFCSYCIIPYTRGRVRSREAQSVVAEVTELAKNGYKEIILTGIHLGSYGKDLEDMDLIRLLEALNNVKGIDRIRIGSIEPNLITEEFVKRLRQLDKICPHFHLSLQSGSDTVLKRMNRKYTTEEYANKVALLRSVYDRPGITTDIIVGFPMESPEEFVETMNFARNIRFSDVHVFKYSIREGTKAASMKPQIDGVEKNKRSDELSQLCAEEKISYLHGFIDEEEEVLFQERVEYQGRQINVGYTKRYVKVYLDTEESYSEKLCKVKIEALFEDGVISRLR
ncbi:MAG: tRNA (N(6)-L-threonylcarbamoyladenosine(37)-C(2))-methylthiotransferase MtaB [Vallitaleaceae bacterium]|nr:tRNA (N(6)-L-threonylcarbamoyladenosine(37)-C(2))-methylthiotransferase MtaB [Vallitaleaceae bacterium]